jgi:hypothetical protein
MKQVAFLLVFLCFLVSVPLLSVAADVNVSIGVGLPPLVFAAPPDVVVVPSGESYVYMVPDTPGVYFYGGYWYRSYGDRWYRSDAYNGRWAYVRTSRIPRFIRDVPPDYYRRLPRGYQRIHYGDLHRDWRKWDRDRHWNRQDWYKNEVREHEKWRRTEGRRPPGERYKPGNDEHKWGDDGRKPGGDIRGPQGDRNRQEGERYDRGGDRRKPGGDIRGPQGDRNRQEGERYDRGGDRRKPGGDIRGPQGDSNRQEGERYKPGNEKRKPEGDDRGPSSAPDREQGQDRQQPGQR